MDMEEMQARGTCLDGAFDSMDVGPKGPFPCCITNTRNKR